MNGNRLLTPTRLSTHLACAHYTQLDRKRRTGELKIEFMPDPRLEAICARGEQHERAYIARFGSRLVDLQDTKDPQATLDAMRAGAPVIVQAPLGNGEFFGIADVLLRVGDFYEPVDTKLARETRAGTDLQLVAYCAMLAAMQGAAPEHFHVVTPEKEETYRTADFGAYFRLIHSRLITAAAAPHVTYQEPVPHCDICNYWKHCDGQRRRDDHRSLIADLRTAHMRELQSPKRSRTRFSQPFSCPAAQCDRSSGPGFYQAAKGGDG